MTAAITLNFRKPELTIECVESLLGDGWMPILVWDNSEDEGVSLQVLQAKYAGDARIHLVQSSVNLGFGKGVNAALAELGRLGHVGPVLVINNDTFILPGMRSAMMARLEDADAPCLVAPRISQDGREQGWLYYNPWFALVTQHPLPGSFAYLSGCCLLVQRADNSRPLFDEDFFMYGEDVELSWRMCRQGACLHLLNRNYLIHEGSVSSGQASEAYERFLIRSHWLLVGKLTSNFSIRIIMYALRIPSLFARAFFRSLRHRSWVPFLTFLRSRAGSG